MPDVLDRRTEISSVAREYILNEFLAGEDAAVLTDTTPLISSGILDSIATARLVSHLENQLDVRYKASEIGVQHMDTIELITATTLSKLKG